VLKMLLAGACVVALALSMTSVAQADALLPNFDMWTTVTTYGGNRTIGSYPDQRYRWLDSPPQPSRISYNYCSDYSAYQYNDFSTGSTSYQYINISSAGGSGYYFTNGTCFVIRGRSLGSSFTDHDGSAIY